MEGPGKMVYTDAKFGLNPSCSGHEGDAGRRTHLYLYDINIRVVIAPLVYVYYCVCIYYFFLVYRYEKIDLTMHKGISPWLTDAEHIRESW